MSNILGDSLIRRLRKEKDLTIAALCDGICSEEHLTRVERGSRAPSRWVFKQLMERLGENPDKYYTDVVTVEDRRIVGLKDQLKALLQEYTEKANGRAETLIETLEDDEAFDTKENRQFLWMSKATLAFNRGRYEQLHECATKALLETKAHFDVDKIDTYFLSCDEIWLVNQIGIASFFTHSIEESTNIFRKLRTIIEKGCIEGDEMIHTYAALLYNLSKNLGILNNYGECLEVCDKGIEWCIKCRESYRYPLLIFHKACCLLSLGDKGAGISLLEKAYAFLKWLSRDEELQQAREYIKQQFEIEISILEF
jgi:tetratricopeptide (TPR) repeat protein